MGLRLAVALAVAGLAACESECSLILRCQISIYAASMINQRFMSRNIVHVKDPATGFATLRVLGRDYSLYYDSSVRSTYDGARAVCRSRGLDLASIPSQQVSEALHAAVVEEMGDAYHWSVIIASAYSAYNPPHTQAQY
jgi:hypothetical protein